MNKKVTGVFCYLGLIFWLIAFLAGDKEGAKLHLNQGLVLFLAGFVGGLLGLIPFVGVILSCVISIAILVFAIMGIVSAVKETDKPLPLIGNIQLIK